MAFKVTRKKSVNVMRVGVKIVGTIIGLYASGFMLTIVGNVMNGTGSPFNIGLRLIGWTITTATNSSPTSGACGIDTCTADTCGTVAGCITSTAGTGILSVIGLLAIVWILFEFVEVRL